MTVLRPVSVSCIVSSRLLDQQRFGVLVRFQLALTNSLEEKGGCLPVATSTVYTHTE